MTTVLVVDDTAALAEQYAYDLNRVGGFDASVATGGREALERLELEAIDCVILDLEMPGTDGFVVLREMQRRGVTIPVIVYTGTGSYERCVQAIRLGAHSFIDKAEPMERVVREIENALELARLEAEVGALRRRTDADSPMIGSSPPMRRLAEGIARVAPIPSPVLIVGDSGTGKELVARELHRLGAAPREPFVAINSAALPETLVESELFGHERGAFTGANRTRRGAFEAAGRGTLFLDEIGELPTPAQAKLLRVLETREIVRVGGERTIGVGARVVAATHRELEAEVEAGRFREDLLYRLNAHLLRVPPLRDRRSDIPELARHLLDATCARFGRRARTLDTAALEVLAAFEWRRNNVRELRNVIERMVIAGDGDVLGLDTVPAEVRAGGSGPVAGWHDACADDVGRSFQELRSDAERRIVTSALARNGGHVGNTARDLGLADHASLLKIMRRLGIKRPSRN